MRRTLVVVAFVAHDAGTAFVVVVGVACPASVEAGFVGADAVELPHFPAVELGIGGRRCRHVGEFGGHLAVAYLDDGGGVVAAVAVGGCNADGVDAGETIVYSHYSTYSNYSSIQEGAVPGVGEAGGVAVEEGNGVDSGVAGVVSFIGDEVHPGQPEGRPFEGHDEGGRVAAVGVSGNEGEGVDAGETIVYSHYSHYSNYSGI